MKSMIDDIDFELKQQGGRKASKDRKQLQEKRSQLVQEAKKAAQELKSLDDTRDRCLELAEKARRKWLVQRGKGHMLDLQDSQIKALKQCFNSLDADGSGAIGVDEIKDPLIGLGLVNTISEVEYLVKLVDEDGSG